MKKILKFLLLAIIAAIIAGYIILQDKPENFVAYQTYASGLKSFETDNGTMKYYDRGDGQPILLVHGVPTNSWMYRNLSQELVDNGYRVIAPDLMGFGASDRMSDYADYDFENQAELLINLMDSLGIDSWEQVTHDMGGVVTLHMVNQTPEKISHMHILNTILYSEYFDLPVDLSGENSLHRWALAQHGNKYIGQIIVKNMMMMGTGNREYSESEQAGYYLPIRDGAESLVHFFTNTGVITDNIDDYRQWLVNSNIPTSIIWGEDDPFLDRRSGLLLQEEMNISDDAVLILPGAKHLIAEESYKEIAKHIIAN